MDNEIKSGKYKHFKDKKYEVYCTAVDMNNELFVLYRQLYGNKSFWIRPYEMFTDKVELDDGTIKKRFVNYSSSQKKQEISKYIKRLVDLSKNECIVINHTENKNKYRIVSIDTIQMKVIIDKDGINMFGGYFSDRQLAERMGYSIAIIDGKLNLTNNKSYNENQKLYIGDNSDNVIIERLNSCSIDLPISNDFRICKRKKLDTHSLNNINNGDKYWKKINHNKSSYIKIKPGRSILTHTKEMITIPDDCAGKIEIKSTYARLSLSITSGDFCNPGYKGFFPLEITNNSKHTIIIHDNEVMAQLLLIPLSSTPLIDYSSNATYKNSNGYDEGTPDSFFQERSIKNKSKSMRNAYYKLLNALDSSNDGDVNALKSRFKKTFLSFCEKKMVKKHGTLREDYKETQELCHKYINHERILKKLSKFRVFANFFGIISIIVPIVYDIFKIYNSDSQGKPDFTKLGTFSAILCMTISILVIVGMILFNVFVKNKDYCTFEKKDIDQIINEE